jgi:hypothetical protein
MQAGPPRQQPPPVVPTESTTHSRPSANQGLTDLDRRFIEAAGVKPKEWKEAQDRYKPGEINILE